MNINEIITIDRVRCNVEVSSKKSALEEIAKLMASSESSLTYTEIFDCLNARERLGSTGLGHGIAIPHGRFQHIKSPTAAFMQLKTGIDYDAVDQKPVDLIFGLIVPSDSADDHLKILSCLAEMCCRETLLGRLRLAYSPEKILGILSE